MRASCSAYFPVIFFPFILDSQRGPSPSYRTLRHIAWHLNLCMYIPGIASKLAGTCTSEYVLFTNSCPQSHHTIRDYEVCYDSQQNPSMCCATQLDRLYMHAACIVDTGYLDTMQQPQERIYKLIWRELYPPCVCELEGRMNVIILNWSAWMVQLLDLEPYSAWMYTSNMLYKEYAYGPVSCVNNLPSVVLYWCIDRQARRTLISSGATSTWYDDAYQMTNQQRMQPCLW